MDIDSVLMDTIIESEFEASMPCFSYHTLRNVALEWTASSLRRG
jgi:hypothetical protein